MTRDDDDLIRDAGPAPGGYGAATFSPDRRYRFTLRRTWLDLHARPGRITFVMLNPSTAGATADDPTLRRCAGFARREGYRRLDVVNLFALIATSPRALLDDPDPVGAGNDLQITLACDGTWGSPPLVVAAWGVVHPRLAPRAARVLAMLGDAGIRLHVLGQTRDGWPAHPLRLRADTPLRPARLAVTA